MVQKLCVKSICMDSDGHIRNRMDDTIENILKSMQIQIRPMPVAENLLRTLLRWAGRVLLIYL